MNAIAENLDREEVARLGKLSDQLCHRHGLHFNPLISNGCARCQEEFRQARQARLALIIVGVVLFAIVTVMLQVTYLWWSQPTDSQSSTTVSRSMD